MLDYFTNILNTNPDAPRASSSVSLAFPSPTGISHSSGNDFLSFRASSSSRTLPNFCSSAEEVEGKIATEYYNKVVNEQNAPIGQCATSEIPTGETRNEIHNFI